MIFTREYWFAWYPVRATTFAGDKRLAWLECVLRERADTEYGSGAWRYYVTN